MWLLPDILVCIKGSGDVYTKPRVRETYAFHRRNLVLQLLSHILHPFHLPSNSRFDVAMGYSFSSRRLDDGHLLFLDAIMLESSPSLVEVHRCNVEASSIGHRTPAVSLRVVRDHNAKQRQWNLWNFPPWRGENDSSHGDSILRFWHE